MIQLKIDIAFAKIQNSWEKQWFEYIETSVSLYSKMHNLFQLNFTNITDSEIIYVRLKRNHFISLKTDFTFLRTNQGKSLDSRLGT